MPEDRVRSSRENAAKFRLDGKNEVVRRTAQYSSYSEWQCITGFKTDLRTKQTKKPLCVNNKYVHLLELIILQHKNSIILCPINIVDNYF